MNNCKAKNSESIFDDDGLALRKFKIWNFWRKMSRLEEKFEQLLAKIAMEVYKLHKEYGKSDWKLYIIFRAS